MTSARELSRLHYLFDNDHPDQVWANAHEILLDLSPGFDFHLLSSVFSDVIDVFYGDYPGYLPVNTPYHDLRHTMDVFMCAVRLLHGLKASGDSISDEEVNIVCIAILMHDIGYAQREDEAGGSGAKYTKTHVNRGIEFMRGYLAQNNLPASWIGRIESSMLCTNPALSIRDIAFENPRAHVIGQLVGTADLVGQMADRSYLEKLLFLFFEFKEAHMGDFSSTHDLLKRTSDFYRITREKLDQSYSAAYRFLDHHFQDWFGVDRNYYMESIDKNMEYLNKVITNDTSDFHVTLKRRGIVDKAEKFLQPH